MAEHDQVRRHQEQQLASVVGTARALDASLATTEYTRAFVYCTVSLSNARAHAARRLPTTNTCRMRRFATRRSTQTRSHRATRSSTSSSLFLRRLAARSRVCCVRRVPPTLTASFCTASNVRKRSRANESIECSKRPLCRRERARRSASGRRVCRPRHDRRVFALPSAAHALRSPLRRSDQMPHRAARRDC